MVLLQSNPAFTICAGLPRADYLDLTNDKSIDLIEDFTTEILSLILQVPRQRGQTTILDSVLVSGQYKIDISIVLRVSGASEL